MSEALSFITKLRYLIPTIPKIGYYNVLYAAYYKLSKKYKLRKYKFPVKQSVEGQFYNSIDLKASDYWDEWRNKLLEDATLIMNGNFKWFSFHKFQLSKIPNWFLNPFDQTQLNGKDRHWMDIDDFNLNTGDIKILWELSRFDWLTVLARAYKVTSENQYRDRINDLLNDWSKNNPLNAGPHWKCGQETSIRVMKLINTSHLLDQFNEPSDALKEFVYHHLSRIEANIQYALIQDNNHGTSEATGLYIGSAWLIKCGYKNENLLQWKKKGRTLLESLILKLIQPQGSFSQRSMTYHRVAVDTFTFVLQMMQRCDEQPFSNEILDRLRHLGEWQYKMTFGSNGDAPNLGSNDGAMLENLHGGDYRDFRISTQAFFAALDQSRRYSNPEVSEAMYWRFGSESMSWLLKYPDLPTSEILDNQAIIMRHGLAKIFVKIPEDTFRPGNDAFHVDIWYNGKCIAPDSGSYSYNAGNLSEKFKSVSAHNTVQFDDHEQMPKIGRFLNGAWIKPIEIGTVVLEDKVMHWRGSYCDYKDNVHTRSITLTEKEITITDQLSSQEKAVGRYRLTDEESLARFSVQNEESDKSKAEVSLFYMQKQQVGLVEISAVENQISMTYVFE